MIRKVFLIVLVALFFALPSLAYNFVADSGLNATAEEAGYDLDAQNREKIMSTSINIVLSLVGVIFIGLMIYGGYTWMTAGGSEEKVKSAKNTITEAAIGLIVVIAAYAISYFVLEFVVNLTLNY